MQFIRKLNANVCIRCGKPRVETKTWKEPTIGGTVFHTITSCPDPDCQKVVDQQLAAQKERQEAQQRHPKIKPKKH